MAKRRSRARSSSPAAGVEAATSFFGREPELEGLAASFSEGARIVTVLGPGGVGKTRLALEHADRVARSSGTAIVICDLCEAFSRGDLCSALARALGVTLRASDDDRALAHVARALSARPPTLLVLDNMEQLVAEATAVSELSMKVPHLQIIATSRVRLRIAAEKVMDLEPLPVPDASDAAPERFPAVQLFLERAGRVAAGWGTSSGDAALVAAMVRRLEGFPLAIELCATRGRVLDPASLLLRLERGFDALDSAPRDAAERHRSLAHAIAWSVSALLPVERTAFEQCAVFAGGFTLEAAEAVLDLDGPDGGGAPVLDALSRLVDASLLRAQGGRFSMYSVIRDHAARTLAEGGASGIEARHADYYITLGERLMRLAPDAERPRLFLERDNLLAMHARAVSVGSSSDPERAVLALRAALVLDELLEVSGQYRDLLPRLDAGLAAAEATGAPAELVARALWARGRALMIGRTPDAVRDLERAVALAADIGDRMTEARACSTLGVAYRMLRRIDEARSMGERAVAAAAVLDAPRLQVRAQNALGGLLYELGELDRAGLLLLEAETTARHIGDAWMEGWTVAGRAHLLQEQSHLSDAERTFERAAGLFSSMGDDTDAAVCTGYRASVLHERGELELALRGYAEVVEQLTRLGNARFDGLFRACSGAAAAELGRLGEARSAFDAADRILGPLADPALHLVVEIHRLHLEHPGRASEALASCRALTENNPLLAQSDDVRFALRIFHRAIAAAPRDGAAASLRLALDSRWFELPNGQRTPLGRKRALWLILHALADARLRSPGRILSPESLLAAGWPDERVLPTAGAHRVQVAVATLRNSGLRDILLSRSGGYMLDPKASVELVMD